LYTHSLFLHAVIKILISKSPLTSYLDPAEFAMKSFVPCPEEFYGSRFYAYNAHGILHLTNDVRHLDNLDSFPAFPYESSMRIF
jgi:hypothetical protein